MLAADFFWCQLAHETQLPADLAALAQPTIDHLAWRFSQVQLNHCNNSVSIAVHSDESEAFLRHARC
jgi:hypothetical protein